ncbi:MAG: hypothetical protein P9L94_11405 [Candidatus Hinthialibacter antarcticus]|nr:hypothetical protein [Candidatus Hinthialibacter antarcticus]
MRTSAVLSLIFLLFSLSAFCEIEYIGSTGTTPLDFEIYPAPNGKTYAYVAHGGAFSIVDVSDWRNPHVIKRVQLDADLAFEVIIDKGRLIVANGLKGIWIYSIANPELPTLLSHIDIPATDIVMCEDFLYWTNSRINSSPARGYFTNYIYDLSDYDSPIELAKWGNQNLIFGFFDSYFDEENDKKYAFITYYNQIDIYDGVEKVSYFKTSNDNSFNRGDLISYSHEKNVGIMCFENLITFHDLDFLPETKSLGSVRIDAIDLKPSIDRGRVYIWRDMKLVEYDLEKGNKYTLEKSNECAFLFEPQSVVNGIVYGVTDGMFCMQPYGDDASSFSKVFEGSYKAHNVATSGEVFVAHESVFANGEYQDTYSLLNRKSELEFNAALKFQINSPLVYPPADQRNGAILLDNNLLVVQSSEGLTVYDIVSPDEIRIVTSLTGNIYRIFEDSSYRAAFLSNGILYRKLQTSRTFIVNSLQEYYRPVTGWSNKNTNDLLQRAAVQGEYIYTPMDLDSDGKNEIGIFSIANPLAPELVGSIPSGISIYSFGSVTANNDWLVSILGDSIVFFDITDPLHLELKHQFIYGAYSSYGRMFFHQQYLILALGPSTSFVRLPFQEVVIYHAPPGEAPEQVFRYTFGRIETHTAFGVAALGDYIYVPGGDAGFYVFRINDDSNVNEWALH